MLICNMAAASFEAGETLVDRLAHVYEKYGFGFEEAVSVTLEGKGGIGEDSEFHEGTAS